MSYPVQVDSDALDGKVTLWSFSDLGGGVEDAPPLILGGFNAMKPSKLYLTVFEELDREDKAQMNSTKTTKDKIKNFP